MRPTATQLVAELVAIKAELPAKYQQKCPLVTAPNPSRGGAGGSGSIRREPPTMQQTSSSSRLDTDDHPRRSGVVRDHGAKTTSWLPRSKSLPLELAPSSSSFSAERPPAPPLPGAVGARTRPPGGATRDHFTAATPRPQHAKSMPSPLMPPSSSSSSPQQPPASSSSDTDHRDTNGRASRLPSGAARDRMTAATPPRFQNSKSIPSPLMPSPSFFRRKQPPRFSLRRAKRSAWLQAVAPTAGDTPGGAGARTPQSGTRMRKKMSASPVYAAASTAGGSGNESQHDRGRPPAGVGKAGGSRGATTPGDGGGHRQPVNRGSRRAARGGGIHALAPEATSETPQAEQQRSGEGDGGQFVDWKWNSAGVVEKAGKPRAEHAEVGEKGGESDAAATGVVSAAATTANTQELLRDRRHDSRGSSGPRRRSPPEGWESAARVRPLPTARQGPATQGDPVGTHTCSCEERRAEHAATADGGVVAAMGAEEAEGGVPAGGRPRGTREDAIGADVAQQPWFCTTAAQVSFDPEGQAARNARVEGASEKEVSRNWRVVIRL